MATRLPLLLVPGWSDRPAALRPLEAALIDAGWPAGHVRRVGFRDRYGSNIEHAAEVAAAARALCAAAGAERIDVVAHSMGGLAVRHYLAQCGEPAPVRRLVFLGTPHAGTWAAYLAWGAGGREMRPRSAFLRRLAATPLPASVETHTIRARLDLRVFPGVRACLPGVTDVCLPWVTHRGMLRSARVRRAVIATLLGHG